MVIDGFHNDTTKRFYRNRLLIFKKMYPQTIDNQNLIYNKLINKHSGKSYDYGYLFWLVWRAFLLLVFNKDIPYFEPEVDNPNSVICHEALEYLPEMFRPKYDAGKSNTPYRLFIELSKKGKV